MSADEATAIVTDTLRAMHQYGLTPAVAMARMQKALADPVIKGQAICAIQKRIQMQHTVIREAQTRISDLVSLRDYIQGAAS